MIEIDDLVGKLLASSRLDFGALDLQTLCARDVALRALERAGLSADLLQDSSQEATLRGDATLLARALGNYSRMPSITRVACTGSRYGPTPSASTSRSATPAPGSANKGWPTLSIRSFAPIKTGKRRRAGALGLGLSLVRRIAQAHGGDAQLENRPQGGALATLSLPRERT